MSLFNTRWKNKKVELSVCPETANILIRGLKKNKDIKKGIIL